MSKKNCPVCGHKMGLTMQKYFICPNCKVELKLKLPKWVKYFAELNFFVSIFLFMGLITNNVNLPLTVFAIVDLIIFVIAYYFNYSYEKLESPIMPGSLPYYALRKKRIFYTLTSALLFIFTLLFGSIYIIFK